VDDHRDVGATNRSDEAIEAGGVVEVAVAEDHGLDSLGVDLEEAHVVHEPVGADAGVEKHAVVAALLGERDERRESVLAPQLLDHLASFESGRACSRHMLGGERKPPRRALVRHEGIG
jgi:hypothetical protein